MSIEAECMQRLRAYRKENELCMICGGPRDSEKHVSCKRCLNRANNRCIRINYTKEAKSFKAFERSSKDGVGSFGLALKRYMVANQVGPFTLGKALCVSNRSIDRWLYENAIPQLIRQTELCSYFNCSRSELGLE